MNVSRRTWLNGRVFAGFVCASFLGLAAICCGTEASPRDTALRSDAEIVLAITGDVGMPDTDDGVTFDMDMLRALPQTTLRTSTPWTDGVNEFVGVALSDLLDFVGVSDGTLRAVALNDYEVEIPVSDAARAHPVLAYLKDGAPMTVRDKGPLWLVYPFDESDLEDAEVFYIRSVWQLERLDVKGP